MSGHSSNHHTTAVCLGRLPSLLCSVGLACQLACQHFLVLVCCRGCLCPVRVCPGVVPTCGLAQPPSVAPIARAINLIVGPTAAAHHGWLRLTDWQPLLILVT